MPHDNPDQGKTSDPFSTLNGGLRNLALKRHSNSLTRTHSGHEVRSFTSCSTRTSPRLFLFLLLHSSPDGQSRPKAPAPSDVFGTPALPDQGSEGEALFNLTARCARSPEKPAAPPLSPRVPRSPPNLAPLILEDTG